MNKNDENQNEQKKEIWIEWKRDIMTDLYVDHIIFLLMESGISEPNKEKRKYIDQGEVEIETIHELLKNKFAEVELIKTMGERMKYEQEIEEKFKQEQMEEENELNENNDEMNENDEEIVENKNEMKEDEENIENNEINETIEPKEMKEEKVEEKEIDKNEQITCFVIKEHDYIILVDYPSLEIFGFNEVLLKRMRKLLPKIKMAIESTF